MLEGMLRAGGDPPALRDRPDIFGLEWLWIAFMDLSTCRTSGMSIGRIPWTAVNSYAIAEAMSPFERRMLFAVIRVMDYEFVEWHNEKIKAKPKSKTGR